MINKLVWSFSIAYYREALVASLQARSLLSNLLDFSFISFSGWFIFLTTNYRVFRYSICSWFWTRRVMRRYLPTCNEQNGYGQFCKNAACEVPLLFKYKSGQKRTTMVQFVHTTKWLWNFIWDIFNTCTAKRSNPDEHLNWTFIDR